MIELRLLGPSAVRSADGRDIGSLSGQPKRFALLAYLAVGSGDGYHRRDTVAALFWPEFDEFAARRALRNTIYHLRHALGEGVIIAQGGETLALNRDQITTDLSRLAEALESGRFEEATAHYRGELLAGLHVPNVDAAFEDWLTRERGRALQLMVHALEALVHQEERAGRVTRAAQWAERLVEMLPGDERWVCRTMSLLHAASDRTGALRLYDAHVRRLAAEFDVEPSAAVVALASSIRAGSVAEPLAVHVAELRVDKPPLQLGTQEDETRVDATNDAKLEGVDAHTRRLPEQSSRSTSARRVVLIASVLLVSAFTYAFFRKPKTAAITSERTLIAVFDNRTGDDRFQSLGRMTQDWLTQGALRTGMVDVVDPRAVFVQRPASAGGGAQAELMELAHRTGAQLVVSGSFYRMRDSLIFEASLVDAKSGRVLRTVGPVDAPVSAPTAGLDALRSRVMTALALAVNQQVPLDYYATSEVPTFEAYRSYVEGWDAFWHGDGARSEKAFLEAAHRDTMFGAAAVAAAMTASNFNHCALIDSISDALVSSGRRVERVDELSLQIAIARCHGANAEMLRLTLERAEFAPRTSGFRMPAAAAALWANRPAKARDILQSINPDTDLGWSTDTTHFSYFSSYTEALHLMGRYDEEFKVATRVSNAAPLTRAWLEGRALAARVRSGDVLALIDSALTLPAETELSVGLGPYSDGRPQYAGSAAWVAVWIARDLAAHGDSTTSRLVAQRATAWYGARSPEERATPEERLTAGWSLELSGDFDEAKRVARELIATDSSNVDYRGLLAGLATRTGDRALADSLQGWLAAQSGPRVGWSAAFYLARDAALARRDDEAVSRLRDSIGLGAWPMWLHIEPAFLPLKVRPDFVALTASH